MGPLILSLFVLFVPACLCFPTVKQDVPPQCVDPSFACQDLESARLCGVVKSCVHDIWSTMSAPDDDEDICQICKEMVKEARDQLLSNMTQEEIKEVFEGSCKLLPIKLVADACIKTVDEFIPELVEMLASRMDPNMVCTVSGLCNAAQFPIHGIYKTLMSFVAHRHHQVWNCDSCMTSLSKVQNFVSQMSKDEFKQHVDRFIQYLRPDGFDKAILHYTDALHIFLSSRMKPKAVCATVRACPVSCEDNNKPKDDLVCQFCTNVLHHVQDLITTNTTVEEFRSALLNFCKVIGKYSNECTNLVNEYFDTVFNFIRNMDSKSFCTLIGLCGNTVCSEMPMIKLVPAIPVTKRIDASKLMPSDLCGKSPCPRTPLVKLIPAIPARKRIPALKLMPSSPVNQNDESETENEIFGSSNMQLPIDRFIHPSLISKTSLECNFCKGISIYLNEDLKSKVTEENIGNALHDVCNKWAHDYLGYCTNFLHKYYLNMKQSILKYSSTKVMCNDINVCPVEENEESKVGVIKDGPLCDLCKTTFDQIQNELKDPAVKKSVEQALYQVCSYLPKSIQQDCHLAINNNIDNIFNILEQELKGDNICPAIHLCSGDAKRVISSHVKDIECDLCKDLVQQLKAKIQDPDMKNSFKQLLERGCSLLPSEISSDCKNFVDQNIDNFVNVIVEELDPNFVCSTLGICTGQSAVVPLLAQSPKADESLVCDICINVVERLDAMLKTGATEEEIKDALDKVCAHLPKSINLKCQSYVNSYSEIIVRMIAENLDPATVCAKTKLCKKTEIPQIPKKPQRIYNDVNCELCKTIIKKVDEELEDQATEDEIKNALDKVCSYLPSTLATKCQNFVNQYSSLLISILAEEMDPDVVCSALKVCPAQDIECQGCQYVFHFIQERLMDSDFQEKIKNIAKEVCQRLPGAYADNCNAFVNEYGSSVLVLVAQDLDPTVMCNDLHACPSVDKHLKKKEENKNLKLDECDMCTTVVNYLDKLLEEDNVDKEITSLIEKVCSIVPSFHDKCSALVETYGPYILQMIGQLADSKEVCQEIDMCPKSPSHI